jgi:hypothetical protein
MKPCVAAVLVVLIGGLAGVAIWRAPEARPSTPSRKPHAVSSPAANALIVAPMTVQAPKPEAFKPPAMATAVQPKDHSSTRSSSMPYRFAGRVASGAESSIVLFGRGRVVTLLGPGPLDDEYVVEAVFDDYLVLRHVPTGVGQFLALAQRQPVLEPSRDPEESPRD